MKLPRDIQSLRIRRQESASSKALAVGDGVRKDRALTNRVIADITERNSGGRFTFVGDDLVSRVERRSTVVMDFDQE